MPLLSRIALFALLLFVLAPIARADMGVTATSDQTTYVRGQTNRLVFHLDLISSVYEGADNVYFTVPAGVTISAVHYLDGFHSCPDGLLIVLGMGTAQGGWYEPGYPSGCGYFGGAPDPGEPQAMAVDVDVPAAYVGDLPIVVNVDGDGCCDPPPHSGSVTISFLDAGAALRWSFDDVLAPALPAGWATSGVGAGAAWITENASADTGPNAIYAAGVGASGESDLLSPTMAVDAGGGELHFHHRFATEPSHDGGVLEIAIDGGAFQDIVEAGGVFADGGYNGILDASSDCSSANANPLAGRAAWSGTSNAFGNVAVVLPDSAAGHQAQFRWRLGSDCAGVAADPAGWWIDEVTLAPNSVQASIGPAKLDVTSDINQQTTQTLDIGNLGGGAMTYAIAVADGSASDCSTPVSLPWLQLASNSGTVAGGARAQVAVQLDSSGLADGLHTALLCVSTNDASVPSMQIPLTLSVASGSCPINDRIFASGFDDASDGLCGSSLRTFSDRDAFLAEVGNDHAEDHYTGLRSGYLHGPIDFGNSTYTYSVFTQNGALAGLYLFAGSGVLSSTAASDQLVITFSGAPVTAIGGNFYGLLFYSNTSTEMNSVPPTPVVLTLDDGSTESFTASSPDDFRGFIARAPIHSLTIATPVPDADGDSIWGVMDNLIVGRAR